MTSLDQLLFCRQCGICFISSSRWQAMNTIKQDAVDFILGADLGYRHDPSQICLSLSEILESVKDAGGVTISTKGGDPVKGFHLIIRRGIDNHGLAMGVGRDETRPFERTLR